MHGQFVWYELTTPDVDAARNFYPKITGWGTQQFDNDYTLWTTGGVPFAGIFRLSPEQRQHGVPPNWMPYIESRNVDDTVKLATSIGGKVLHGPADIPGTGRYAVLQDPQEAVFGVYSSTTASQSWDGTPVLGRFSWHELMTTNHEKAFDFYRTLFGWDNQDEMDMGGGNKYVMFGSGKMFGGMFNRTPAMAGMHPFWLCYIFVKDVNKAVDATTKAGGRLHRGPMDIPGGVIAILADPQGAGFAVHQATAAVPAARPAARKSAKPVARPKAPAKKTKLKSRISKPKPRATKPKARAAIAKRKSASKGAGSKKSKRRPATKAKRRRR